MSLPTREELNPYDDLDGRVACEHFLGKSLDEAEALFRANPIVYQDDLMWMGVPAFRFYLPAVILYVRNEPGDISDFVACLSGTLQFRLEHEADELIPVAGQLIELCDYILEHWSKFEEGTAPYGDIRSQLRVLRETFLRMGQKPG